MTISAVAVMEQAVTTAVEPGMRPKAMPGFSVNVNLNQSPIMPKDRRGDTPIFSRTAILVA